VGSPPVDDQQAGSEREPRERLVATLQATTAIAQALGGETDLDAILELIAARGRELVDARWSAILILDRDELELRATAGDTRLRPIGHRYRADATIGGEVLRSGTTRKVATLSDHAADEDRDLVQRMGAECALLVPLAFRGRGVGVLMVASDRTEEGAFTAEHEHLLEAFAASAATAIATAQDLAADQLRQSVAAAEQERRRWARELHDETLQELGAVRMLIDSALAKGRPEALEQVIGQISTSLDVTIAGLKRMVTELRPAALDELGVAAAVTALADRRRTEDLDIAVVVDLDYEAQRQETRLAPEVESTIYRIVQEGLANIHKHARASCAEVTVRERDGEVIVEIRDDGRGLGSSDTAGTGLGIAGMRERAVLLGGSVEIGSSSEGTVVRAALPAHRVAEA
jgi:signal transduction histidine kinase